MKNVKKYIIKNKNKKKYKNLGNLSNISNIM